MKLNKIAQPVVDLSDKPPVSVVTKLAKNDLVVYEGEEWTVEFAPKKARKGVWWLGLSRGEANKYIKIVENVKPAMTDHEKKTMINNIVSNVEQYHGVDDAKLVGMIPSYYHNLSTHNNYDPKDVRECMSHFPIELLKESGVVV